MKTIQSNLNNLKVGIIGCGWLGIRIAEKWQKKNHIYTSTTSKEKVDLLRLQGLNPILVDFNSDNPTVDISLWEAVSSLDVLIITAPISSRKDHDIDHIKNRIRNLSSFIGNYDGQLFFMNSTSIYPHLQKEFTEEDVPVDKVLAEQLLRAAYPQVNILRLGGLMGDDRQLSKYPVSNLQAPVNHIHFYDIATIIERMIENRSYAKVYNVVAPKHPTKQEVIAMQKNQPPTEGRSAIGRVISSNKLMEELNYQFIYPDPRYFHLQ
ncbi:Rossmann-fold NAD(P)-binding domain-containing protein [Sphingobacterium arenae]|uniref:Epimerase n=1 Tax=Sphingobacterium arenae TaxID=1280598 RepID=A0ABR7Y634_9SPHI|nr:hypothetical protein [Sphingobacterium arenae]MBD1426742.1 hypothetical protein [Sphingobacterium arenae]